MTIEQKKGRGRPPDSLKIDAMRETLKLRLTSDDLANAHRVAELVGEDISEFVRVAIRQRCNGLCLTGEPYPPVVAVVVTANDQEPRR